MCHLKYVFRLFEDLYIFQVIIAIICCSKAIWTGRAHCSYKKVESWLILLGPYTVWERLSSTAIDYLQIPLNAWLKCHIVIAISIKKIQCLSVWHVWAIMNRLGISNQLKGPWAKMTVLTPHSSHSVHCVRTLLPSHHGRVRCKRNIRWWSLSIIIYSHFIA